MSSEPKTISAKSIVFKNKSPDQWFGLDYNMNIYHGCPHGCIYCDSRSDCYGITDFDTVRVKENALEIIRNNLRRKVKKGVVGTGAMSDPYNPLEKTQELTRHALELINAFGFGAGLTTKSDLIARDVDILQDIKTHSPVIALFSITTANDDLCKKIEPAVASTSKRFAAMKTLAQKGIFCGVLLVPLLPYITDTKDNIIDLCNMAKANGAKFVYTYMGMTLRSGNRQYYYKNLDNVSPDIKFKYINTFGNRYHCPSPHAKELFDIFANECERLGLLYDMKAIIYNYKHGYRREQLTLF